MTVIFRAALSTPQRKQALDEIYAGAGLQCPFVVSVLFLEKVKDLPMPALPPRDPDVVLVHAGRFGKAAEMFLRAGQTLESNGIPVRVCSREEASELLDEERLTKLVSRPVMEVRPIPKQKSYSEVFHPVVGKRHKRKKKERF